MGNTFDDLYLSNGATDVFLDVLTLAGSSIASRPWEQHFVLNIVDRQRFDRGVAGFDLSELPWTDDWQQEKAFVLRTIDLALSRHRWELLGYDPPFVAQYLTSYRSIVDAYKPVPTCDGEPDWRTAPPAEMTALCPVHEVFIGEFWCRLCP